MIPLGPYFWTMLPICQGAFFWWCSNHVWIMIVLQFISLLILCPWKSFGPLPRFPRPCGFASSAPDVKTWALWPMDQKRWRFRVCFYEIFFHKKIQATFDVQVLFECSNSSHAGLKRHFDTEKSCGDSDFVMVSPIYSFGHSTVAQTLQLKQNKMKKTYKIWGAALNDMTKKHQSKFHNELWEKQNKNRTTAPPILIRFLLLADEVGETIPKTSKLFWIERTKGVEDRWRILLHSTAALTRHLWTSICWICYGTKRSWERGMGRPGDLLRGWSRTRMNEKV